MGRIPPSQRVGLRRAVVASVAVHAIVLAAVLVLLNAGREGEPPGAGIKTDTRVRDIAVRISTDDIVVSPPAEPPTSPTPPVEPPPATTPPPPERPGRTPHAITVPQPLSHEVAALIRRPANAITDPNIRPVASRTVPPMHGAMRSGQSIVYLLDCSGSMGEFGKLDVARDSLLATLRHQPPDVKFQVIVYSTTARSLLAGGCVATTPANVADALAQIGTLKPAGRSNHLEAVRLAAVSRPDVIVILTDAADLSVTHFNPALAGKLVPVCVGTVTAEGVTAPRPLR